MKSLTIKIFDVFILWLLVGCSTSLLDLKKKVDWIHKMNEVGSYILIIKIVIVLGWYFMQTMFYLSTRLLCLDIVNNAALDIGVQLSIWVPASVL
jgi:hypothetical protein